MLQSLDKVNFLKEKENANDDDNDYEYDNIAVSPNAKQDYLKKKQLDQKRIINGTTNEGTSMPIKDFGNAQKFPSTFNPLKGQSSNPNICNLQSNNNLQNYGQIINMPKQNKQIDSNKNFHFPSNQKGQLDDDNHQNVEFYQSGNMQMASSPNSKYNPLLNKEMLFSKQSIKPEINSNIYDKYLKKKDSNLKNGQINPVSPNSKNSKPIQHTVNSVSGINNPNTNLNSKPYSNQNPIIERKQSENKYHKNTIVK